MSKKIVSLIAAAAVAATMLAGCGSSSDSDSTELGTITVITREDGSGTRSAFIELTGVEEKDSDGNKSDNTKLDAVTLKSTDAVLTQVSGDTNAIGYISLGSLSDDVKAVKVGGVEATVDNIKSGSYEISRPFNIATKGDLSDATQDFINYIMSKEGQEIITEEGYVSVDDSAAAFESTNPSGTIKVNGSSSVTPVMTKLKEAYEKLNSNVSIEVQQSDSTSGMKNVSEGVCDIGMASRELSDTETGLDATTIAMDGIAVIVNKNNTNEDLSVDTIKQIYTGEITEWADIK